MKRIHGVLRFAASAAMLIAGMQFAGCGAAAASDGGAADRAVAPFDRVEMDGAFTATITAGAERQRVALRGDADTLARVTTTVKNRTLTVSLRPGLPFTNNMNVEIFVPHLKEFANNGAGKIDITGLRDDAAISNAGAASIRASGRSGHLRITIDGTGSIDTKGVDARDVNVDSNGVGSVVVRGSGKLVLRVNGVGSIRYAGRPTSVDKAVNGIGSIEPL